MTTPFLFFVLNGWQRSSGVALYKIINACIITMIVLYSPIFTNQHVKPNKYDSYTAACMQESKQSDRTKLGVGKLAILPCRDIGRSYRLFMEI